MSNSQAFRFHYHEGIRKFDSASFKILINKVVSVLRGQPVQLLSYHDIRCRFRLREENYRGLQDIRLNQIVGSVGRYDEFTRAFLPTRRGLRQRWSRVYAQTMSEEGVPPIEVYQVGDVYFVRDGNHRVSVARQLGASSIHADVIELTTPIGLEPTMSTAEIDAAAAYAQFLDETRLRYHRADCITMQLSEPSRYNDMLGHIYLHQRVVATACSCSLNIEEAALHWYDTVFAPVLAPIKESSVLAQFPQRTPADLYLWLVDNLCHCAAECGSMIQAEPLSALLTDFLATRTIERETSCA